MAEPATNNLQYQAYECLRVSKSFFFFILRYCWIEDKTVGEATPFKLWPSQVRVIKKILRSRLMINLKARQLGITWIYAAYVLWRCITRAHFLAVIISAKEDWAVEFLDRVRFIRNRLPAWMCPPCDKDGAQHMRFIHEYGDNGKPLVYSEIKSLATTVEGAQSKTPDALIMDETSRNRYARQIYSSSKPGIDKAGGIIHIISNSHKDGTGWGWTRRVYVDAMKGKNGFDRVFQPWWDCPERPKNFKAIQLSEGMDEEDFSQQYPESEGEAISPQSGSYFGKTLARHSQTVEAAKGITGRIIQTKAKDHEFEPDNKGIVELWRYPYHLVDGWDKHHWTRRYCIGSDISEGLGQSYSVAYVMDRHLDELVCRIRSNRVDAAEWAKILFWTARYYGFYDEAGQRIDALICVERTGAGQTTVKELKKLGANQYVKLDSGKLGSEVTHQFGWSETEQAKHELCGDLKTWFRATKGGFYCPVLLDEASTTIRMDSGKLGPQDDQTLWDSVVAAGCTIQASNFMGEPAKRIPHAVKGWRKRIASGKERDPWAM